jgi:hypothetical protein
MSPPAICGATARDILFRSSSPTAKSGRIFLGGRAQLQRRRFFSAPPLLAARIVAGLDAEIHVIERNRALLTPPASLDAWRAYHRGLAHIYRFTSGNNREAQQFFTRAIALDPTFSRSYAGLSFTHFQNAFLLQAREREREIALAFAAAPSEPWAAGSCYPMATHDCARWFTPRRGIAGPKLPHTKSKSGTGG